MKNNLIEQLLILRTCLLKCVLSVVIAFLALVYFSNDLYQFIAAPLIRQLPAGSFMIATDITAPFLTPIKLTVFISFFVVIPYILFQIWQFIAPALYKKERKLILPLVFSSTLFFYIGVLFAYFVVFPIVFYFFINTAPQNIAIHTDINKYLDFVLTFFIIFGLSFELPIVIVIVCLTGLTTIESLKKKRAYFIVTNFAIAMFLTPPDVFSQSLLAIPMCILFEIGLLFTKIMQKSKKENY